MAIAALRRRLSFGSVALRILCVALILLCCGPVSAQQDAAAATGTASGEPELEPESGETPAASPRRPAWRSMEAGGLVAEVAAMIMTGQQGGTLLFEALIPPISVEGRVPVLLEIDGTDLLAEQEGETLYLESYVYVLTPAGGLADSLLRVIELDLAQVGERVARGGVLLLGDLHLPEGDYSIRVLVRNRGTSSLGLRVIPLAVAGDGSPASATDGGGTGGDQGLSAALPQQSGSGAPTRMILPPLLSQPDDAWLSLELVRNGEAPTSWAALGVGLPSARPVILGGGSVELQIVASDLPPKEEIHLDVTRFDGSPVTRIPVSIGDRSPALGEDWMLLQASFDADELGPGDYLGRLLLGDGSKVWSGQIPIHVLARAFENEVVWAELTGDTSGLAGEAGEAAAVNVKSKLAIPADEVRSGFLDALRLYSDGRTQAAIRSLSELEAAALGGSGTALDRLRKVELRATLRLVESDPDLLLPIAQLYRDMYQAKYEQREYLLSTHSRRMIVALADLYTEIGPEDSAREVAASYLAGLAARLLAAGMPVFGDEMFSRALRLDSSNKTSLLCLATGLERRGHYGEAIERLRRLVEADPRHWEGHLRLAVNLEREDRFTEAETIFLRLLDDADEDWVVSVAFQELGGAYIRRDRLGDAERTLRRGIERLPDEQKLHLQLAFLLDSRRDSHAASQQLERLDPNSERPDSVRFRYSQLPLDDLDAMREELDARALAKLPDLQTALRPRQQAGS